MIPVKTMQSRFEQMCVPKNGNDPLLTNKALVAPKIYQWLCWVATQLQLRSLDPTQTLISYQLAVSPKFIQDFNQIINIPPNFANPPADASMRASLIATAVCTAFAMIPTAVAAKFGMFPSTSAAPAITAAGIPTMTTILSNTAKIQATVQSGKYDIAELVQAVHAGVQLYTWVVPMVYPTTPSPTPLPLPLKVV